MEPPYLDKLWQFRANPLDLSPALENILGDISLILLLALSPSLLTAWVPEYYT